MIKLHFSSEFIQAASHSHSSPTWGEGKRVPKEQIGFPTSHLPSQRLVTGRGRGGGVTICPGGQNPTAGRPMPTAPAQGWRIRRTRSCRYRPSRRWQSHSPTPAHWNRRRLRPCGSLSSCCWISALPAGCPPPSWSAPSQESSCSCLAFNTHVWETTRPCKFSSNFYTSARWNKGTIWTDAGFSGLGKVFSLSGKGYLIPHKMVLETAQRHLRFYWFCQQFLWEKKSPMGSQRGTNSCLFLVGLSIVKVSRFWINFQLRVFANSSVN